MGIVVPPGHAEPIRLGVAGPQSGDLASYGIPSARAAELVVRDINAKGGVLGRQVKLLVEDGVCKPEIAANTAGKLVSGMRKKKIELPFRGTRWFSSRPAG